MVRFHYWINKYLYMINSFIISLFILNHFISNNSLEYVIGVLTVLMFLLSFSGASKLFKILSMVFTLVGASCYLYSGLPLYQIPKYLISTMPILALLLVLPFMTSAVQAGRYDRRLNEIMKGNVNNLGDLYVRSSFTTFALSAFLNISALHLSQEVLINNMKKVEKKLRNSFISQVTLRGLALALVWSPLEIIVALTVDATGISYLSYLPWLLLCAIFMITIDGLLGKKLFGPVTYHSGIPDSSKQVHLSRLIKPSIKLLFAFTIFLLFVISIGTLLEINFILSVSLIIPPFAFIWALAMKRWYSFKAIGFKTWKDRANHMQNFVVLFVSLAFFSNSLNGTSFQTLVNQVFLNITDKPLLVLLALQIMILLMGLIGVHAIATIGILLEIVNPLYSMINPLSIGIVIITGALATLTVGAYGVTVTMTSSLAKQNPYRITVQNMPFALIFGFTGVLMGFLLL